MLTHEEGRLRFLRRRADQPRRRLRRGVYLLPSLLTMGNMFCGYACIVYAMRGEFETAAPFIGFAVVLDMLDGRIARLTGAASDFGLQFDSLADVISFGVAPADPDAGMGTSAARSARMGRRVPVCDGCGHAAGALQHPKCRGWRQAVLRRDAQPCRGWSSGGHGVRLSLGIHGLSRGASRPDRWCWFRPFSW